AGSNEKIGALAGEVIQSVQTAFDRFEFSKGLEAVWSLIGVVDKFIVESAPWKLIKSTEPADQKLLDTTLYTAAEAVRVATALLIPILPQSAPKIWSQLGIKEPLEAVRFESLTWGGLKPGESIGEVSGVFPRIDPKQAIPAMKEMEERITAESAVLL